MSETRATSAEHTVLLVDDEPSVLRMMGHMLSGRNMHVLMTQYSQEAFEIYRRHRGIIDLLITDVRMDPHMGGVELARRMRLLYPAIKVLYVSGYPLHIWGNPDTATIQAEIESCRAAFIQKPFDAQFLLENLRALLHAGTAHNEPEQALPASATL